MTKRACMHEWTTGDGALGSNHMCVGDHDHAGDHKCGSCDATCARDAEPAKRRSTTNIDNVHKYLDVSTGNLPEDVFHAIEDGEHDKVVVTPHPYGLWVWVPPADGDDAHDVSAELPTLDAIYKVARSLGCRWINFDQDAQPLDGDSPFFTW